MPYSPRHLAAGENPPSIFSQILADYLPAWTDARTLGLPDGPSSLTATSDIGYSSSLGSHYQRFINAFALELEILGESLDELNYNSFLTYPGVAHTSMDMVWEITGLSSAVTAVGANLTNKTLSGQQDAQGNLVLDPNRAVDLQLLQASRLYDFYYGISIQQSFDDSGTYVLSSRVGQDADGTNHVEWVTINGSETEEYTVSEDLTTVTVIQSIPSGATIVIHYTTYDCFYQLADYSKLYVRENFLELILTGGGVPTASGHQITGLASNQAVVVPGLFMVWNELDELGILLNKPRMNAEGNAVYARRLVDATLYQSNPTLPGLRNALATEMNLIHHVLWGATSTTPDLPAVTTTATSIDVGSPYQDSVLIDKLPLAYYSVVGTAGQTGAVSLALPSLAPGASTTITLQLMATGGPVVPTAVPISVSTTVPQSQCGVYDQITVKYKPQTLFSAPTQPWIPGSLILYKNGYPLTRDTDFFELSSTVFQLASPAQIGDTLQLGYIYSADTPDLEAQSDIDTDLAPIVMIGMSMAVDTTADISFAEWLGVPPGTDLATIPTNATWTITFTVTNGGSSASTASSILVTLPPLVDFDGQHLTISNLTKVHDLRYIDSTELWVNNLTDAQIQPQLYNPDGTATSFLTALAQEISQSTPLVFGQVSWDRSFWGSLATRYSQYGFLPQVLDPQYEALFTPQRVLFAGTLQGTGTLDYLTPGPAMLGIPLLSSTSPAPFSVSINPGATIGTASSIRYKEFQSGIGFGDDLEAGIVTQAQIDAISSITQPNLPGINPANLLTVLPEPASDMWLVTVNPGTYYLNQEEHYLFSQPVYAVAQTQQIFLPNCQPNSKVCAYEYDPVLGMASMRQVYNQANGQASLQVTETLTPADNLIYLQYENISNFSILSAADSNTYVPVASGANVVQFANCSTELTVQYTLKDSYAVIPADGGSYFYMDAPNPDGVLVMYEGGAGAMISNLPLHPYYNPRSSGFLYVNADLYLPTKIWVWVDPTAVPADGVSSYNVKVLVQDDYGSGLSGLPVNLLVGYREGALSISGVTDSFGYMTANLPAQSSTQTAQITASVQLTDSTGNPLPALIGTTFIQLYSPLS